MNDLVPRVRQVYSCEAFAQHKCGSAGIEMNAFTSETESDSIRLVKRDDSPALIHLNLGAD